MATTLKSHELPMGLKIRILQCYVFSVLYYGVEAWTLTAATEAKLEAFEMWLYRRMLRVSWTQRVTNEEILRRMGKAKEVLATVKRRKLQYLGHIMRHEERYQLPICILQGSRSKKARSTTDILAEELEGVVQPIDTWFV